MSSFSFLCSLICIVGSHSLINFWNGSPCRYSVQECMLLPDEFLFFIRKNVRKGRYVITRKPVKTGDILFVEEPFVLALQPDFYYEFCHFCLKPTRALIPWVDPAIIVVALPLLISIDNWLRTIFCCWQLWLLHWGTILFLFMSPRGMEELSLLWVWVAWSVPCHWNCSSSSTDSLQGWIPELEGFQITPERWGR